MWLILATEITKTLRTPLIWRHLTNKETFFVPVSVNIIIIIPDIRLGVVAALFEGLGRHVVRCPCERACHLRGSQQETRDSEITQLYQVPPQEYVPGI